MMKIDGKIIKETKHLAPSGLTPYTLEPQSNL